MTPKDLRPQSRRHVIKRVTAADLDQLVPLMVAYCAFYETSPGARALRALAEELLADPLGEGFQLIARAGDRDAVGFATVFWNLSTTRATRVALMNDLYLAADARGSGLAERLIRRCAEESAARGIATLEWQTRPDNERAQRVYERVGGKRSEWLSYELATGAATSVL